MTEMYKLARPKLDGVPCKIINSKAIGVANKMTKDLLNGLPQFQGEIVYGKPQAEGCYQITKELLDEENGFFLFVFWVYDLRTTEFYSLENRLNMAEIFVGTCGPNVQYVEHELITDATQLEAYKAKIQADGFAGIVLREPHGTFGTEDETILF